jgi:hypothetical protein
VILDGVGKGSWAALVCGAALAAIRVEQAVQADLAAAERRIPAPALRCRR